MTSRWANWSSGTEEKKGFSSFLKEGQAQDEAEQQGLEFAGFGWYRDPKTGKRVAKIVGDQLVKYDQGMTPATTDTGNPTTVGYKSPADKARAMGLQSDGSGGYIDPSTGQLAARTVNNELVFYDSMGGAVSDGSGGAQLTQSAPSWVDPVSGLIVVPPAQPESPEEQAAVPDPIPALAPMGLDAFFNKRKIDMYQQQAAQDGAQADMDAQQMEVDEVMNMHPGMRELQRQMQGVIQRAGDSGDEDKMEASAILRDMLDNEAGSYLKYFMVADDEDKDQIVKEIKTLMINTARQSQAEGKLGEFPDGDLDRSDEATEASNARDAAKSKIDMMKRMLGDRHDKNTNVPNAPKMKAGKDFPKKVESENVTYTLKQRGSKTDRAPNQSFWASSANTALRDSDQDFRIDEKGGGDGTFVLVDWDVNSDNDERFDVQANRNNMGSNERKTAALDALRTWRNDVLPQLQPGIVLMANPMDDEDDKKTPRRDSRNQRERLYQLAGFGQRQDNLMAAVVVRDENGDNTLLPVNPTEDQQERASKITENYMRLLSLDLNSLDVEVVYDMLFS